MDAPAPLPCGPAGPLHSRPEARDCNVSPRGRAVIEPADDVGGSQSPRNGATDEKGPQGPFFYRVARPEGFEPPTLRFEA